MARDPETYGSIARRYDRWVEHEGDQPTRPPRLALPGSQHNSHPEPERADMGKYAFAAIGVGIGVLILLLAALSFYVSAEWAELDRYGAATGYFIVGFFLVLSGGGGIWATLNHNFRVLARSGGHS